MEQVPEPEAHLKSLELLASCSGHRYSLLSVHIPLGAPIAPVIRTLQQDCDLNSGIRSRRQRIEVVKACEAVIESLGHYKETPGNGLVLFCGCCTTDEVDAPAGFVLLHLEPLGPIQHTLCIYGSKFACEALEAITWAELTWTTALHCRYPAPFRLRVLQVLLVFQRLDVQHVVTIPSPMQLLILAHLKMDRTP